MLSFILGLFLTTAHAAENVQIVDAPTAVIRNSSEHNRMNKNYSVTYMAFGVGPSRSASVGLTLGVFLDRNSEIDLEFIRGIPTYLNWYSWSEYDIKTSSVGLHYKHFVGNSFYFRVGADYRKVDYRYTSRDIITNAVDSENKFTGDSIAATILIGNQWQWDNFTLGCDWIGAALPLTSNVNTESLSGPNPNSRYLKEDQDWLLKNGITMALRFYLGATF